MGGNAGKIPLVEWKSFARNRPRFWIWFSITAAFNSNGKQPELTLTRFSLCHISTTPENVRKA